MTLNKRASANLQLKIEPKSETLTDGAEVVSQDPPPGRRVRARSTVTATIATPEVVVMVPDIVGLKVEAAEERLRPSLVLTQPAHDWPVLATVVSQRPEATTPLLPASERLSSQVEETLR